ncbi:hypothetical protein BC833DRAFT_616978 [Globomyces pollinis-pini]|nr:hypothetical protein BC833DRAFT_616978 [Globomyces pollinis-pini]
MTSIWFLKVVIACPSFKRPSAEVTTTFFSTADDAKVALKDQVIAYMNGHHVTLKALLDDGEHFDYRYRESYMDQVPFEASVVKIDSVNGKIEETKVWDYQSILDEFADEFYQASKKIESYLY